jgi:hypothetical protein
MPKLGVGINLDARESGSLSGPVNALTLYEDPFVFWPTSLAGFLNRQFFSSENASYITSGSGYLQNNIGGSHLITYFDCLKEQYPKYLNTYPYALGSIVYGGIYGHALFQRTGNAGVSGFQPNFLYTPSGTQDTSGWTRYRPTLRTIQAGKTLTASFTFTAIGPGTIASNAFRFGILDSTIGGVNTYLNEDNLGLVDARFGGNGASPGYRGYMTTFAGSQKIFTRTLTTSTNLISSISSGGTIWTENVSTNLVNLAVNKAYNVVLKITRPLATPTSLLFSSMITGNGVTGPGSTLTPTVTWSDSAPSTFSFDTFVAYTTTTGSSGLRLENVKIAYS